MKRGKILLLLLAFSLIMIQALTAQTYEVRINCNVKGADLYVDGKYAGKLPGEFRIKSGKHFFKLNAPGYQEVEKVIRVTGNMSTTINMEPGGVAQPTAVPSGREYKITITSNVSNADIFIDGVLRTSTPAMVLLKSGTYTVKLMARGYIDATRQITVNGDASFHITLQLLVTYYPLEIRANVKGARVFINGKDSGETPVSLNLPEGNYAVRVVKQDYAGYEQAVRLHKATRIDAVLEPLLAYVIIRIPKPMINNPRHDFAKRIEVFLDDKKVRGLEFTVPRGLHRIRVVSGALALETAIDFAAGKTYELKPALAVEMK